MISSEFIKPADIPAASMELLLATYARLTGRAVTRFASRAVAERRVTDALMSSADQRGHLGVPRGTLPGPTAQADAVALAAKTGRDDPERMAREGLPGSQDGLALAPETNPYPQGSLAASLWAEAEAGVSRSRAAPADAISAPTEATRNRALAASQASAGAAKRTPIPVRVRPAATKSAHRLQAESLRAQVYAAIEASGSAGVDVSALETRFGKPARGCVAKLLANRNIESA